MASTGIDWTAVKATVIASKRTTGMVGTIEDALREIMSDGKEYTVAQLTGWIDAGLNENRPEDDQIQVNWVTVKYTLTRKPGFKMVSKNTFVMDASAKPTKKSGKK